MADKGKILGALWGAVVGDALGLPVEFRSREEVRENPVATMEGYGTFNLPPGSWSDDSSLMLCTTESLLTGFDTKRMGRLFIRWLTESYWTPWGETFDVGRATHEGVSRMIAGAPPEEAGGISEHHNGNGSLMRILPVGLYFSQYPAIEMLEYASRASSLTHGHPRAQMACGLYCLMASRLLAGSPPVHAYRETIQTIASLWRTQSHLPEIPHFERLLSGAIETLPENDIRSDGYAIHTLEASLWCLLTTTNYRAAVLKAVNLGEDTDTTATVTGGLAGLAYGIEAIPKEWIAALARREEIGELFGKFADVISA